MTFWEDRAAQLGCANHAPEQPVVESTNFNLARSIMGATHPVHEMRIGSLVKELERWEEERLKAVAAPAKPK